jgi:hypothetical protein
VAGSADFWFGSTKRRPLIGSTVLRTTPMLTFHHFQVFFYKGLLQFHIHHGASVVCIASMPCARLYCDDY